MPAPLALFSLALAAGGGSLNNVEAQQRLAAGYALLSRSAVLVCARSSHRAAILLPPSGAFLTALAGSDGHGAVVTNPLASRPEIARQLSDADISAVFTSNELSARVPPHMAFALLEDAPRSAQVIVDGVTRTIDLGHHSGLSLSGRTDIAGRDEEAVIVYTSAMPFAHLFGLVVSAASPLLCRARVTVMPRRYCFAVPALPSNCRTRGLMQQASSCDRDTTLLKPRLPACLLTRYDKPHRRGTMGTAIAGLEVTIRDKDTAEALPAEAEDEICVRGNSVFRGYVSGSDDGLRVRNGWLHTGGLGVMHAAETFTFRGLIKPMFTRNGFNIYPAEIESA